MNKLKVEVSALYSDSKAAFNVIVARYNATKRFVLIWRLGRALILKVGMVVRLFRSMRKSCGCKDMVLMVYIE